MVTPISAFVISDTTAETHLKKFEYRLEISLIHCFIDIYYISLTLGETIYIRMENPQRPRIKYPIIPVATNTPEGFVVHTELGYFKDTLDSARWRFHSILPNDISTLSIDTNTLEYRRGDEVGLELWDGLNTLSSDPTLPFTEEVARNCFVIVSRANGSEIKDSRNQLRSSYAKECDKRRAFNNDRSLKPI